MVCSLSCNLAAAGRAGPGCPTAEPCLAPAPPAQPLLVAINTMELHMVLCSREPCEYVPKARAWWLWRKDDASGAMLWNISPRDGYKQHVACISSFFCYTSLFLSSMLWLKLLSHVTKLHQDCTRWLALQYFSQQGRYSADSYLYSITLVIKGYLTCCVFRTSADIPTNVPWLLLLP